MKKIKMTVEEKDQKINFYKNSIAAVEIVLSFQNRTVESLETQLKTYQDKLKDLEDEICK